MTSTRPQGTPTWFLPMVCFRCHKDIGAVMTTNTRFIEAMEAEGENFASPVCKECFESIQEFARAKNIPYFRVTDIER